MNWMGRAAAAAALTAIAGCGSASMDGPGLGGSLRQAAGQLAGRATGRTPEPAPPADPQAMAAEALKVNPGPLILVGLESAGTTQVMALTGENGRMRTYMTENQQAVILRDGLVIGTRGLGNDLNVAEVGTEGLIRSRRAGHGQRLMRSLAGDGREHALPLNCTVSVEGGPVIERCENGQLQIENRFIVGAGGGISVSRQWLNPRLGYVTVQTLRP
ncbi:YjbF family lipoprotein [Paracoccus suum]|uniref:YjbF family lipoprotein n=2 Tax=Paracoccus suum TaxID=2259340 RepID=A0A344PP54_9RHOB|nr:YjbF family lipoprotein [Paracoccus suum]